MWLAGHMCGYSSLLVSLANTKEPLYFNQSGANRPSHEGVVDLYDRAIALVREAGFSEVLLRGDTDFALTANFDHWDDQDVEFAFGFDARAMLVAGATSIDDEMHHELVRRAEREVKTRPRGRPVNVKQAVVRRRGFKVLRTAGEDVCEFTYRPPGLHARLPGGRVAQGPVGRARRERAVPRAPLVLLHHEQAGEDHERRRDRHGGPHFAGSSSTSPARS